MQLERIRPTRRAILIALPFGLAACSSRTRQPAPMAGIAPSSPADPVAPTAPQAFKGVVDPRYAAITTEPFPIAAIDTTKIDPRLLRQSVPNITGERPGVVVVDTASKFLYLTQDDGSALRYGVGVGREGFSWSGRAIIDRKQEWPKWHPPKEMQLRDPEAAKWPDGMPGGIGNPLGPRALYLAQNGKDTYFRIHGTTQPESIGQAMSSGCIRLLNQDIIDLYARVPTGTEVVVLQTGLANGSGAIPT